MKNKILYLIKSPDRLFISILLKLFKALGYNSFLFHSQNPSQPITIKYWFWQKVIGINRNAYWPVDKRSKVYNSQNIRVGIGSFPGYMPGCYIQGIGKINIGDYSIFGPNVGIISANHDIYNHQNHNSKTVEIGSYCWIGMNAVVLPDVSLGNFTIVAAGSVVKDSFKEGYCIIAGNPAVKIKDLEKGKCIPFEVENKNYIGYLSREKYSTMFPEK